MESKDWTLLVISKAQAAGMKPVQLQKSLFLLSENLNRKQLGTKTFYKFEAYDYGPFSADVYADADELEKEALISIKKPPTSRYRTYGITAAGKDRAASLQGEVQDSVNKYVTEVVQFTQSLSFNDLVKAIYKEYPEMKKNSIFRG